MRAESLQILAELGAPAADQGEKAKQALAP